MTMPITDALLHVLKSNPKVNVVKIEEKYDKISLEYPEYNPAHRFGISVAPSIGNENYDKPGLYTAKELNDFSLGLIPVVKGRQWHKAELRGDYFNGCLYLPNIHFFEIIGNKETRKTVTTTITDNSALESDVVQKFLDKNSKVEEENIQDIVRDISVVVCPDAIIAETLPTYYFHEVSMKILKWYLEKTNPEAIPYLKSTNPTFMQRFIGRKVAGETS